MLRVLEPIWFEKTDTARRVRQRVEAVLSSATVREMREGPNPARWSGNLSHLLSKPSKIAVVKHHPALDYKSLPKFMRALRDREGGGARALEFLILTAARSGEVRLATWDEIDVEDFLWTVPADRMKGGRKHRVLLNAGALRVLRGMDKGEFLFPAPKGGVLSNMSISAVCRRMSVRVGTVLWHLRTKKAPPQWLPDMGMRYYRADLNFADWTPDLPMLGTFSSEMVDDVMRTPHLKKFWLAVGKCELSDDIWFNAMHIAETPEVPSIKKDLDPHFEALKQALERHVDLDVPLRPSVEEVMSLHSERSHNCLFGNTIACCIQVTSHWAAATRACMSAAPTD